MSKGAASFAALTVCVALVGAGWLAAASLAGKTTIEAATPVPNSLVFTDATGEDPQGLAPDIHRVAVSNAPSDEITVRVEIPNRPTLVKGLRVDVYLDTDRDSATGHPGDGADFALAVIGARVPSPNAVALSQWTDGTWHEIASTIQAAYRTAAPFGPVISVPRTEIGITTGFDFVVVAEDSGGSVTASDRAPDAGEWTYPLTFPPTTASSTTATQTTTEPTSTMTPSTTEPPTTTSTMTTTVALPPSTTTTTVQQQTTATTTVAGPTTTLAQATTTVSTTTVVQSTTTSPRPVPDLCPNVRGVQKKVPRGMVKWKGNCLSAVALAASGLVARPARPTAGQRFAVGTTVFDRKTNKGLPSALVSCPAVVAGEEAVVLRSFFDARHSAAYCYWMIPASARGLVFQGAVVATYRGAYVRRSLRARVS